MMHAVRSTALYLFQTALFFENDLTAGESLLG